MAKKQAGKKKPSTGKKPSKRDSNEGTPNMSDTPLKLLGIVIHRTTSAVEGAAGALVRLDLSVEVENTSDNPLHVWASRRDYGYDPATRVLTVYLAEPTRELPPYIKMISDHPRVPAQVVANPKSRATIKVPIPPKINRPGPPGGPTWVEEPIGRIDHVDIHIQQGTEPIEYRRGENPADFRMRLRAHGGVVQGIITPTETEN
jgi:hypothetical protein